MFCALGFDINYTLDRPYSFKVYIPGATLLCWLQETLATVPGVKPTGAGSQSDPFQLNGPSNFVGAWRDAPARRSQWAYYNIAGRVIVKVPNNSSIEGYNTSDGYYMADVAYSGLSGEPEGTIWKRKGGASYREFGKFIHSGGVKASVEGVDWSQRMASAMRMLLKGTTRTFFPGGTKITVNPLKISSKWQHVDGQWKKTAEARDANKNDTQAALPLLAAVMFIAEPARNPRAWPMGLMLLDLMGEEFSPQIANKNAMHFTFERALVSPARLDVSTWKNDRSNNTVAPPAWVNSQARNPKEKNQMSRAGSAAVEGVYPASPKWSSRTRPTIDVQNDYIQQKEVSLLCRWLELAFNRYRGDYVISATALLPGEVAAYTLYNSPFDQRRTGLRDWGVAADLTRIIKTDLIARRARSFDSLGTLFL